MSVLFIKVTLLENTAPHDIVAKRDKAVTYPAVFLFPQGFPDGTYIALIIISVIGSGAFLIGICGQIVCRVHLFDQKTSPVIDKGSFHDTIGVRYLLCNLFSQGIHLQTLYDIMHTCLLLLFFKILILNYIILHKDNIHHIFFPMMLSFCMKFSFYTILCSNTAIVN